MTDSPDFAAKPAENLEYYVDHKGSIIAGVIVSALALVLLLWFLGVGLEMAAMAMFVMPAIRLDERDKLSLESATTFMDLGNIAYGFAAPLGFGVLFFAIALLGFRVGAVPKWWAVITGLLGIVMIVPYVSWTVGFVLPIWVVIMVILLMRAEREAAPAASAG